MSGGFEQAHDGLANRFFVVNYCNHELLAGRG
jgi:hypothetical protein